MMYYTGTTSRYLYQTQVTYPQTYTGCQCTWTVCQCMFNTNNFSQTAIWYTSEPPVPDYKTAHRQRMQDLIAAQKKVKSAKVRLPRPSHRPQMQALSVRIR